MVWNIHVCVFLAGRMKVLLGSSSYFLEYIHAFLSSHNIKLFNNRYLFCLGFQVVLIKEKLLLLFCIPSLVPVHISYFPQSLLTFNGFLATFPFARLWCSQNNISSKDMPFLLYCAFFLCYASRIESVQHCCEKQLKTHVFAPTL